MKYGIIVTKFSTMWRKKGNTHRLYGHAHEWSDGSREWYKNDSYHRQRGPAIEWSNGYKAWYINGSLYIEE